MNADREAAAAERRDLFGLSVVMIAAAVFGYVLMYAAAEVAAAVLS